MKPVVVHDSFTYWNPTIFDSYEHHNQKLPGPRRLVSVLKIQYTMAIAFLVLQQLPRERHFLHEIELKHRQWYSAKATRPGQLLPFLQPGASWRSLVVPIGEGKFELSVRRFSGNWFEILDSPELVPLQLERSVSGSNSFTMNDVITHFVHMAKHKKDGAQARDILRQILQSWSLRGHIISAQWGSFAEPGLLIICHPISPLPSADSNSSGIPQKRMWSDISNE